jgi:hypothetical protein
MHTAVHASALALTLSLLPYVLFAVCYLQFFKQASQATSAAAQDAPSHKAKPKANYADLLLNNIPSHCLLYVVVVCAVYRPPSRPHRPRLLPHQMHHRTRPTSQKSAAQTCLSHDLISLPAVYCVVWCCVQASKQAPAATSAAAEDAPSHKAKLSYADLLCMLFRWQSFCPCCLCAVCCLCCLQPSKQTPAATSAAAQDAPSHKANPKANYADLPTSELKSMCKQRGLSIKGQRAQLLLRLQQHKA